MSIDSISSTIPPHLPQDAKPPAPSSNMPSRAPSATVRTLIPLLTAEEWYEGVQKLTATLRSVSPQYQGAFCGMTVSPGYSIQKAEQSSSRIRMTATLNTVGNARMDSGSDKLPRDSQPLSSSSTTPKAQEHTQEPRAADRTSQGGWLYDSWLPSVSR